MQHAGVVIDCGRGSWRGGLAAGLEQHRQYVATGAGLIANPVERQSSLPMHHHVVHCGQPLRAGRSRKSAIVLCECMAASCRRASAPARCLIAPGPHNAHRSPCPCAMTTPSRACSVYTPRLVAAWPCHDPALLKIHLAAGCRTAG